MSTKAKILLPTIALTIFVTAAILISNIVLFSESVDEAMSGFIVALVIVCFFSLALVTVGRIVKAQEAAVREEHERARIMLDATPLAIRLWNKDLRLIGCNEAAVKLFFLKDKQEYIKRYFELTPEYQPDGQRTVDTIKRSITQAFEKGEYIFECIYQLPDGTPVPCENTLVRVPYENDYVVAAYSRDLRVQKKMMSDIELRDNLLFIANRTASILFDTSDYENIEKALMESMETLGRSVGADRVHIMQNETIEGSLHFICKCAWIGDSEITGKAIRPGMRFPYSTDADWEEDFTRGKCVNGPVKYLPPDTRKFFASFGIMSMLVIPVFVQGRFWGRVGFSDCGRERVFDDDEVDILRSASLMMAVAINRSSQVLGIRERDYLLETVNNAADVLLRSEPADFITTLHQCMGMMAEAIHADSMYLCKNHIKNGKLCFSQLLAWTKDGMPVQDAAMMTDVPYEEQDSSTNGALLRGEVIHSLSRDLPPSDTEILGAQGVLAIMTVPVFIQNEFWGFIGFDNCHSEQLFTENEESIMRSGSLLIVNAFLRNEYMLNIHETYAKLQAALANAEEANNAKSSFLAHMSHEMRTPLNAVIGLGELMLSEGTLSGEAASNLEKIYNAGSTILSIVNDILDISKIESGKFELYPVRYDTPSFVNDVVTLNIVRIGEKPVTFKLYVDENLPGTLYGDDLRVKQIFNNLLSNAFKYTNAGTVEWRVSFERDGDDVWLISSVSDTGIGIKPDDVQKLFSDYNQVDMKTNRRVDGTGLGLAITKRLVDMMDGSITVESEYGKGSLFGVRLRQSLISDAPIGKDVTENLTRLRYTLSKRTRNTHLKRVNLSYAHVLIVDDIVTNLDVVKGMMKPYGLKIDCALSGPQAIEMIRAGIPRYSAIFMDHMMPGMDGIEATRIIREEIHTDYARNIPIIALTANAIVGNEEMFLSKGFQDFISKPIDMMRLDSVLRCWVRDKSAGKDYGEDGRPGDGDENILGNMTIGGMDIAGALKRFGGDEAVFADVLRSYALHTGKLLGSLREYLAADKFDDYAIVIHGIKGSSYGICALETGRKAEALEAAVKEGKFDELRTEHVKFERTAKELIDNIDTALGEVSEAADKPTAASPDAALLNELRDACKTFDMDRADAAMEKLESFRYESESGENLVAWLREQIDNMTFEKISGGEWPSE